MDTLWRDMKFSLRMLVKNPGFTLVAVIALALAIGANTAIFSVVNTVLLRPLPFHDPGALIMIREMKLPEFPEFSVAPGNYLDWKKQNTVFEQIIAFRGATYNLVGIGEPERLRGALVSAGTFNLLGVHPLVGRGFAPEEDQPGRDTEVLLSEGLWQRRFGSSPNIVGQQLNLSGRSYTVIGIMPASFQFPGPNAEVWAPLAFNAEQSQEHGGHYVSAIGRLKPNVSLKAASTEMKSIAQRMEKTYPESNTGWSVKLTPLLDYAVTQIRPVLLVLMAAVALVLLIACANVANLLLARATAREKEIAIRGALGASRARVIRQLLTESAILAVIGAVVGVFLAWIGLKTLLALAPEGLPRMQHVHIDARALLFTVGITLSTGLIFGMFPAIQIIRTSLSETLKEGGRSSGAGAHTHRVRNLLVVAEVAIAMVLLVGAGLLIKSFVRLMGVDPGFDPRHAIAVGLTVPQAKYPKPEQQAAFCSQLLQKVSTLPGVVAVGASHVLPMQDDFILTFNIKGRPPAKPGENPSANYYAVTTDYFKAMGIPLLRGRTFTDRDVKDAPRVALISDSFARRYFPNEDPVGRWISMTNGRESYSEIVGIVGDVKQYGLAAPTPAQMYEPFPQDPFRFMNIILRTANDPVAMSGVVRSQVRAVDPDQPVSSIITLDRVVADSVARARFSVILLAVFSAIALVLSAVGIYGVMAYAVSQRTHEMGIRLALGAEPSDVMKLVVLHGMAINSVGLLVGVAAALALTRLLSSLLFGVKAYDPLTFVGIALLVTLVSLLACYVPARRAMRVDPIVALRWE
jgi:putative ABC transport system permease protein